MESNFNNRDFEEFVKQNADQYRMFPSEKVWNGINNALHKRRRWYGIGLVLLLLTSGTVTWVMLNPAPEPDQNSTPAVQSIAQNNSDLAAAPDKKVVVLAVAPEKRSNKISEPFTIMPGLSKQERENVFPFESVARTEVITKLENNTREIIEPGSPSVRIHTVALPVEESKRSISNSIAVSETKLTNAAIPATIDNDFTEATRKQSESLTIERKPDLYPMTIESVINSYKPSLRKKLALQVYFTPTVSYRKLRENKSYVRSAAFANSPSNLAALTDVNSVVTHKPDLGLEFGASMGYQATSIMKFKAGVQFNVSRYDIKAFTYNGEVATIALNSGSDVVNVSTNLRNKGGYKANWLQNLYFSVSAPVGLEIKLGDNGKSSLNIGGTLQPTYILSDRAYMISTDYKNYVEVPWLIRRWNITTSVESFVQYATGKLKWQVGPQVRYQLLSSFQEKYPVRENLFDFGLKVGVMLNR